MWRPISEYPTTPGEQGPLVLARTAEKVPYLVVYREGKFFVCPGIPVFYGNRQLDFMTVSSIVEFMEIPE